MEFKVIEIKQSVLACNDRDADELRAQLKEKGVPDRKSTRLNSSH